LTSLLVAKLDRLSRDAEFLLRLQKSKVRFTACDMPEANEMTVGLMAVIAQGARASSSRSAPGRHWQRPRREE
jgi:hypothetical protein